MVKMYIGKEKKGGGNGAKAPLSPDSRRPRSREAAVFRGQHRRRMIDKTALSERPAFSRARIANYKSAAAEWRTGAQVHGADTPALRFFLGSSIGESPCWMPTGMSSGDAGRARDPDQGRGLIEGERNNPCERSPFPPSGFPLPQRRRFGPARSRRFIRSEISSSRIRDTVRRLTGDRYRETLGHPRLDFRLRSG